MADRPKPITARRVLVSGRIQGVGYRPFVLRLARRHGLCGWVRNRTGEVEIHIEGAAAAVGRFIDGLTAEAPTLARPEAPTARRSALEGLATFEILDSEGGDEGRIVVPPDRFVCADCLAEMADRTARRYRYPFTNCTQCGPRYTIIDRMPYDRPNTAMAGFELCADCRAEYEDLLDRRYHAQPLACPSCGPTLIYRVPDGRQLVGNKEALAACLADLRQGLIVAIKGVGGYHLMCDARSHNAVERLRARKHRPSKPLAVMVPQRVLEDPVEAPGLPSAVELALLQGPERPIVLVPKSDPAALAAGIAPGLSEVGLMLPYAPLHHLLLEGFDAPLVATSANLSGEPVLTDPDEVERALGRVADAFLHHDRPIRRPADDAVFLTLAGAPRPVRLGRGLAPVEIRLQDPVERPMLAVGADLKNTVALAAGDRIIVSPHLGDLSSPRSLRVFEQVIADLCRLYGVEPACIVCDAHPGYFSTRWALGRGLPVRRIWHHHAHAAAIAGEFPGTEPLLVFTWDGLGWGEDGSLWGGEALLGLRGRWQRVASLRPFRLIGGDKAAREPWRCALAVCLEAGLEWSAKPPDAGLATAAWQRGLNCAPTSSIGRLFDAAAALLGIVQSQSHEAEAAMRLEALAHLPGEGAAMPLRREDGIWRADWSPLLPLLLDEAASIEQRASFFHASLVATLYEQARLIRREHGTRRVGLAGGVFQNRRLTDPAVEALTTEGFEVLLPQLLPVNDAAIAFGQIVEANAMTMHEGRSR